MYHSFCCITLLVPGCLTEEQTAPQSAANLYLHAALVLSTVYCVSEISHGA